MKRLTFLVSWSGTIGPGPITRDEDGLAQFVAGPEDMDGLEELGIGLPEDELVSSLDWTVRIDDDGELWELKLLNIYNWDQVLGIGLDCVDHLV
ncbi:hypothetical protein K469DRAFT_719168 [Zopfia rhizophila CBS 207.26]|uniref:Uncharacterized protein n=1 Tax=Zopfia rhizophila CBS 207.26 TaxID=1314779 RepID=A0A6A6EM22_9PEZI|nr:hypothetical protein K469DRAFT_719168 [Zopfia rhizophila CBS 207.26]